MSIEEMLKDAMDRHVADVHAAPTLGRSVRRARRAHTVRFRTAGAALVTAAVAVAVPVALNSGEPGQVRDTGTASAVVADKVTVPDVQGKKGEEAKALAEGLGLKVDTGDLKVGDLVQVTRQNPAPGTEVEPGSTISLGGLERAVSPQDLGDLGDGREFGGIRLGYVPEDLSWGKWSGKDGFGTHSYTTSFDEPNENGYYSIQLVVYAGDAVKVVDQRLMSLPRKGADTVRINGEKAFLANVSDSDDVAEVGERMEPEAGTHTIGWKLRDDLAVQVMMSQFRVDKIGNDKIVDELTKIAEGIRPASE